jgi:hypothetical protein
MTWKKESERHALSRNGVKTCSHCNEPINTYVNYVGEHETYHTNCDPTFDYKHIAPVQIKKGDILEHPQFGIGKVIRTDDTYSIPMIIVKLSNGKYKGETIIRPRNEWKRV